LEPKNRHATIWGTQFDPVTGTMQTADDHQTNSLSDEDRRALLAGEFGRYMQHSGGALVAWIFWRGIRRSLWPRGI
jgi:hypothetical protein